MNSYFLLRTWIGIFLTVVVLSSCSDDSGTESVVQNSEILPWDGETGMNTQIGPGENFYLYANGKWLDQNPIPSGEERWGIMQLYSLEQDRKLTQLLQTSTDPVVATLVRLSQDFIRTEDYGQEAIASLLEEIDAVATPEELQQVAAHLMREGYKPFVQVDVIPGNRNERVFYPLLNVSKPFYPVKKYTDEAFLQSYAECMAQTLGELDLKEEGKALQTAYNAISVESKLASYANEASYDALHFNSSENLRQVMSLGDMRGENTVTEWLRQCGVEMTCMFEDGTLNALSLLFSEIPLEELKDYLYMHVIQRNVFFLPLDGAAASWIDLERRAVTDRYKNYKGGGLSEWRINEAYAHLKEYAPALLSRLYAQTYTNVNEKEKLEEMVGHLRTTFRKRIVQNTWLSEGTKARALEKLDCMKFCISFPEEWPAQSEPNLTPDSYCTALADLRRWAYTNKQDLFGKSISENEWSYLLMYTPLYTNNCFYTSPMNSLVIETTFSISPFFDPARSDSWNYATLGIVIGHEMTHGFDSNGSQFDKNGALASWWEYADQEIFTAKQQQMIRWFDRFEVLPGIFKDGERTLTENIADLGGISIAYDAFLEKLNAGNFTEAARLAKIQQFFLSYARFWCGEEKPEFTQKRLKIDNHSLGKYRVLGIVPMLEGWYQAFSVQSSDAMYLRPEERIIIW